MSPTLTIDRLRVTAACLLAMLAAVAVAAGSPLAVRAAEHGVLIQDSAFGTSNLTVAVGDTVTWTNADSMPHTVSAENGSFGSGNLDAGQAFTFTFTAPGTYAYRCDYHSDMVATVVVETAVSAQPTIDPAAAGATAAPAGGEQPNTAVAAQRVADSPIAPLLIGLGMLAFALAVVPARSRTAPVSRIGGWRR